MKSRCSCGVEDCYGYHALTSTSGDWNIGVPATPTINHWQIPGVNDAIIERLDRIIELLERDCCGDHWECCDEDGGHDLDDLDKKCDCKDHQVCMDCYTD